MSNVLSFADARRRAGSTTIFDDAQQMVEEYGPSAGLIAGILANTSETSDAERPYWTALAEEIERIQGFAWYTPDIGEIRGPAPNMERNLRLDGLSDHLFAYREMVRSTVSAPLGDRPGNGG